MPLSPAQVVTLAEIAQVTLDDAEFVDGVSSLTAEQETVIAADIVTWNLNRDDVDVWLENPSGANWLAQRLLDAIRSRVRKALGMSLISWEVSGYSQNVGHTWVW